MIAGHSTAGRGSTVELRWDQVHAWRLRPLAWQGALCHGPSQAGKVTFTRPDSLVSDWPGIPDPDETAPTAISAYLGAYGPSTPEVFDAWLSRGTLKKKTVRGWFATMEDHEVTVALFAGATAPPFEALEAKVAHLARATGRNRLALRMAQ